jgi:hypothetical protein
MLSALILALMLDGPPQPLNVEHDHATEDRLADDAVIYLGLAALDLYSSAYALKNNPDAVEGNPAAFNARAADALKLGGFAVSMWGTYKLRRAGHHGWATAIRITIAAVTVGVAVNNFRLGNRH